MSRDVLIQKAKEFAIQVHEGHKRASGENYYEHTFRVYEILRDAGIEEEITLVASILHQSLDFSNALEPEIEKRFGSDVLKIVQIYRKLSETNIERTTPRSFNEKYILQTYINMAEDIRALVIRLADKIDNLETSFVLTKEKRTDNAQKALYFYSPLARLIGMNRLAIQLENNAFKILKPGEYAHLEKLMKRRKAKLAQALSPTQQIIESVLEENKIKAKVQFRIKHLYGIYRKATYLTAKGVNVGKNLEYIYDVGAMRIIVENEDECYIVENLLKEYMECLPDKRDDYIRVPRHTGYKSIHNIFKLTKDIYVEIQIRTQQMHEQAEFGPASHLLYKIGDKDRKSGAAEKFKGYLKDDPFWFKDMRFLNMENTIAGYKPTTPFSKYVYAFTPKGDIIELPKGSTLLDFAYAVHTTLGHSCIGGFANGQIVKLTYEIKDGDHIEIKTLKNKHKPSPDWIKIVKTSKARTHIRKALKLE